MRFHPIVAEMAILRIFERHGVSREGERMLLAELECAWRDEGLPEAELYCAIDRFEAAKAMITLLQDGDYHCFLGPIGAQCVSRLPRADVGIDTQSRPVRWASMEMLGVSA